jgi:hypothetical protein
MVRLRLALPIVVLLACLAPVGSLAAPTPSPSPTPAPGTGGGTPTPPPPSGPVAVANGASGADVAEATGVQVTPPTPPVTQPTTTAGGGAVPPPTTTATATTATTPPATAPTPAPDASSGSASDLPREAWAVLIAVLLVGLGVSFRTIRSRERRIGFALLAFCFVYLGVVAALLTGVAGAAVAPPTGAVAVAGDGEVQLLFDAPPPGRTVTIVRSSASSPLAGCSDVGDQRWTGLLTDPVLDRGRANGVALDYILCTAESGGFSDPVHVTATPTASVDVQAPARVGSPRIRVAAGGVGLSWKLPADADLDGILVVRRVGHAPTGPDDGVVVAQGRATTVLDHPFSLLPVHYAIYAFDQAGNVSSASRLHVASYDPPLRTPFDDARVHGTIHLSWRAGRLRALYEVLVFRSNACCVRPRAVRTLHASRASIAVKGLARGRYTWIVSASTGGRFVRLGSLSFTVT